MLRIESQKLADKSTTGHPFVEVVILWSAAPEHFFVESHVTQGWDQMSSSACFYVLCDTMYCCQVTQEFRMSVLEIVIKSKFSPHKLSFCGRRVEHAWESHTQRSW